jgi:hypothetical protein
MEEKDGTLFFNTRETTFRLYAWAGRIVKAQTFSFRCKSGGHQRKHDCRLIDVELSCSTKVYS